MSARKVMVFVDEANATGSARGFNRKMEWCRLRDYLADPNEGRELVEMVVYVGLPPTMPEFAEQREKRERFLHWLRCKGFLVVTKDGSPTEGGKYKANVDVMMAIDAVELAVDVKPDIVVLVTGDVDFAHLSRTLRRRGMRVEVASVEQTLSSGLRAAANDVIDLTPLYNSFPPLHGEEAPVIGTAHVFNQPTAA
jgi:uncharacterized LabA/DUF88 family protein